MWDFRKYQVSDFSKWLLDSIWHQPVFKLLGGHHSLYAKAKELDRVKDLQEQLFHIKKLLKTCRFADRYDFQGGCSVLLPGIFFLILVPPVSLAS